MNTKALHIHMDIDLIRRVDEFRWRNRLANRKESLELLVRYALDQKVKATEMAESTAEVSA